METRGQMACFLGRHQQDREWDSVDVERGHGPDRSSLVLWTSHCLAIRCRRGHLHAVERSGRPPLPLPPPELAATGRGPDPWTFSGISTAHDMAADVAMEL